MTTNSDKLGLEQPNQMTSVRVRVPYFRHDELSGKLLLAEDDGRIVSPNTKIREKKLFQGIGPKKEVWSIRIFESISNDPQEGLGAAIAWISRRSDAIKSVLEEGLECYIFSSIWFAGSKGFVMSIEDMNYLSNLGISFEIVFYNSNKSKQSKAHVNDLLEQI